MKPDTRLFIITLIISALFLSAISSGDQDKKDASDVSESEEDVDIKIDFDIFKKVGSVGKYIVPRVGADSEILRPTSPGATPPGETRAIIGRKPPSGARDAKAPSPPVIKPSIMPRYLPSAPSLIESGSKTPELGLGAEPLSGAIPALESPKESRRNIVPDALPPTVPLAKDARDSPITGDAPDIPVPGSITASFPETGSLLPPRLETKESYVKEESEPSPLDIPSAPRAKSRKEVGDFALPQKMKIDKAPHIEESGEEKTMPSIPDIQRPDVKATMKIPDSSLEKKDSPAYHPSYDLPDAPLLIDSAPLRVPPKTITLPSSPEDSGEVLGLEIIAEIPAVAQPDAREAKIPDRIPASITPSTEAKDMVSGIMIADGEIEYKIIEKWKGRNLLYDGDFEFSPSLEKDAWFLENCDLKRMNKWSGEITLTPETGRQIAVVYGEANEAPSLYQIVDVESLSELIDKGKIRLNASVSASRINVETENVKLTILFWGMKNGRGEILKRISKDIPVRMGVWEKAKITIEEIPASTRLVQFHILIKSEGDQKGALIALDAASIALTDR